MVRLRNTNGDFVWNVYWPRGHDLHSVLTPPQDTEKTDMHSVYVHTQLNGAMLKIQFWHQFGLLSLAASWLVLIG